jgi:hypothetical protein
MVSSSDFLRAPRKADLCNIEPPASPYASMRRAYPYRGRSVARKTLCNEWGRFRVSPVVSRIAFNGRRSPRRVPACALAMASGWGGSVARRCGALWGLPTASDACLSPVPVVVRVTRSTLACRPGGRGAVARCYRSLPLSCRGDGAMSAKGLAMSNVTPRRWGNRPAQLVDSRRFWVLRFRLMVKRGPWLRPQASEGEAQHGPFCWIGRIGQGDEHLHCG